MKICEICQIDISDRYKTARFCLPCGEERNLNKSKSRYKTKVKKEKVITLSCQDCSEVIISTHNRIKYCDYCKGERKKAGAKKYRKNTIKNKKIYKTIKTEDRLAVEASGYF